MLIMQTLVVPVHLSLSKCGDTDPWNSEDEDVMEVTEETEKDQDFVTEETETDPDFVPPTSRRESRSRTRGSRKNINPSCLPTLRGEAFQSGQQQTPTIFTTLNPPALFFFFLPSNRETRIFAKSNFI